MEFPWKWIFSERFLREITYRFMRDKILLENLRENASRNYSFKRDFYLKVVEESH